MASGVLMEKLVCWAAVRRPANDIDKYGFSMTHPAVDFRNTGTPHVAAADMSTIEDFDALLTEENDDELYDRPQYENYEADPAADARSGTGKSFLIHALTKYTQIVYGKSVSFFGSVLKTAPTGGAAFNIGGHTWHSALGVFDKPFGGIHTILAGDFYQMKPVGGTPIVERMSKISPTNLEALEGKNIFTKQLTHYVQLVHNVRAQSTGSDLSPLAKFTRDARVGNTRLIAKHLPSKVGVAPPNDAMRRILYGLGGGEQSQRGGKDTKSPTYVDLCVGSRVRITMNLSTECGLYNGAMGTVWMKAKVPRRQVKGLRQTSVHWKTTSGMTRLIPIVPIADRTPLVVDGAKYTRYMLPIRPAHARTGHSIQGYTAFHGVVVDNGSMFYA
eukprot:gene37919-46788_t